MKVDSREDADPAGACKEMHPAGPCQGTPPVGLREDEYPLSPLQHGLLFHSLLAPLSGIYVEQVVVRLPEALRSDDFFAAWSRVVERHDILRTCFRWLGPEPPVQRVLPAASPEWETRDWRHLRPGEQRRQLKGFLRSDRRRGFDLARAPLLRLALLRMGETDFVLVWTFHHILLDGRSIRLVLQEVFAHYTAFHDGHDLALPPAPRYRDFIQSLQDLDVRKAESFWKQLLQGITAATSWTDGATPRRRPGNGTGVKEIRLSPALTARLRQLARIHQLSVNTFLLAAWALLLHRYTGEDDILFGAVRACRHTLPDAEAMVGLLVNTLPIRVRMAPDTSLLPWLKTLRAQWTALREYEQTPLNQLQTWSGLASGTPLFKSVVTFERAGMSSLVPDAAKGDCGRLDVQLFGQTNYPLRIAGYLDTALLLKIEYDPAHYGAAAIGRMVRHLATLLADMADNPEKKLADLELLTPSERHRILHTWNDTRAALPPHNTIEQLFEAQAERTPGAVALIRPARGTELEERVTYAELNRRASQLARFLRTRGAKPGDAIGVLVPRSVGMIVSVLAVFKAGGVCLPLDPSFPRARLESMVADARPPIILIRGTAPAGLERPGIIVVDIETAEHSIATKGTGKLASGVQGEDPAYIVFTSGSTGRPKGIVVPHRALVNLASWQIRQRPFPPGTRTLQFSSLSFDISFQEMFSAWGAGGTLVLLPEDRQRDAGSLARFLSTEKIERLFLPPAMLLLLADTLDGKGVPGLCLKEVFAAGEQLGVSPTLKALFTRLRGCALHNQYGASETHIATSHRLPGEPARWPHLPTVGRCIANARVYILDRRLQPVPIGVTGEVYIGGMTLALGYLNRAELTRERFLPDPFRPDGEGRMYRTGDLARFRPDGAIEFEGRADDQIKLRGHRIEPGEIESVLRRHPAVQEVVVQMREDRPGDRYLAAYVLPRGGRPCDAAELKALLMTELPSYMVPSALTFLPEFPMTPTGKIDRRALPAPEITRQAPVNSFVAPRNPMEKEVADVWKQVLRMDRVGVHDNFFELGGDSLRAIQLASAMTRATGQDVSVGDIFKHPTIAAQVSAVAVGLRPGLHTDSPAAPRPSSPVTADGPAEDRPPLIPVQDIEEIGAVDAAAIAYLPRHEAACRSVSPGELGTDPLAVKVLETSIGRVAVLYLPLFDVDLYADEAGLIRKTLRGLEFARKLGARVVSLTGLIPSATRYGISIRQAAADVGGLPRVTTGHATTAATVVMTVQTILRAGGRHLAHEHLGVLGLGSIGTSTLLLMLQCLPQPAEISLCDLFNRCEQTRRWLRTKLEPGLRRKIRVIPSGQEVPPELYDASLIVGATNVPDVLRVSSLRPGSLIVDDSAPHCFNADEAVRRLVERRDILFSEGGVLKSPRPLGETRFTLKSTAASMSRERMEQLSALIRSHPVHITGCVLSSLLSAHSAALKPSTGRTGLVDCIRHYEALAELGFEAADPHCLTYRLPDELVADFQQHFSSPPTRSARK